MANTKYSDYWGDLALQCWVNVNPSPQWANRQIEPYRGLPFGTYLHSARPRRQRTLTGPLEPSEESFWDRFKLLSWETEQRTEDQSNCGFLSRLPYDIRIMIYEMVLGGNVLHLSAQSPKSRIIHYTCNRPEEVDHEGANHTCSDSAAGRPSSAAREERPKATGLLPLLVCCRQIYSEAINTLYSANTFAFTQNFAAFTFLKIMVPPQRIPAIRRFRLHMRIPRHPSLNSRATRDWQDLWAFFDNDMTGLQSLYLELQMLQPTEAHIESTPDDKAESWIKPIVAMAVDAYRRRGCVVELETRHVRHYPAQSFFSLKRHHAMMDDREAMSMTCTSLHRSIRLSLG